LKCEAEYRVTLDLKVR